MPLTFPSSPTVGQQSTQNGRTYAWSGSAWEFVGNVVVHKSRHATGGDDALSPADIGAVPTAGGTLTGTLTHAVTQTFVSALGSAASTSYSFTGDTNTGLFSSAADTLGLSTGGFQRLHIDANGNVGIGNNALSNTRLTSSFTLTNATGFGMQCNAVSAATSTGAYSVFGSQIQVTHNITAGLSNTGVSRAMILSCARNNGVSTDEGSLGFIRGMDFQYGHGNTNAAISPTTTQVIGLQMTPLLGPGTITTLYDIYIGGLAHNTGTITGDHFALFQVQATAKNYFAGHVGIGTTAPTTPLDVNGSTLRLRTARTPTSTGAVGEVCWDADYVWICTATNTWRRVPHSTSGAIAGTKTLSVFTPRDNQPPATAFATLDTRNSVFVLSFDASVAESAVFVSVIPEGTSVASGIVVRLWWMAATATSGNVVWAVSLMPASGNLATEVFAPSITVATACNSTPGVQSVSTITFTGSGVVAGEMYRLKVDRVAATGADTMAGDAQLVAVEVRIA